MCPSSGSPPHRRPSIAVTTLSGLVITVCGVLGLPHDSPRYFIFSGRVCVISHCFTSDPVGLEDLNLSLGPRARPRYPCHCLYALRRPGEHNLRVTANIRHVDPRDGIVMARGDAVMDSCARVSMTHLSGAHISKTKLTWTLVSNFSSNRVGNDRSRY